MTVAHLRNCCLIVVAALLATACSVNFNPVAEQANDAAKTHTVIIKNFKFIPEVLEVKPGDKIKWVNQDIVPHTATAHDKSWDTGEIASGESKVLVVNKAQSLSYYCAYHPIMQARLEIES
jgi:plastocyanin